MPDVFISYARENQDVAQRIAAAIAAEGYDVWWDDDIPPHVSYSELIAEKIGAAKAAIVIWSRAAAASEWVRAEADIARGARKLIQTSVDGTTPPLPFNLIQFAAIGDWNGEPDHPGWRRVKASIAALCGAPPEAVTAPPMPQAPVTAPPPAPPAPAPPPPAPLPAAALQTAPSVATPDLSIPPDAASAEAGKRHLIWAGAIGALALAVLGGAYLGSRATGPAPVAPPAAVTPQPVVSSPPSPTPAESASAPTPVPADRFVQTATVEDPDGYTNVRAGPAETFGVIGRIVPGEIVGTYPQSGDWRQVRLANGRVGFVAASRLRPAAAGAAHGQPAGSVDGGWTVMWTAVGTAYIGRLDVSGATATLDVTFQGMRVRQDCGVETRGADVRIRCRNARFTQGAGRYSPDSFEFTLRDGRMMQGRIRDEIGVTAPATFLRR